MLFLNFFLPAALLSNQRGFWKSKNIPIFAIYGYNVSQSMSSGHTLRMYSFLEGYWNCALASSFFLILRKAAPSLSFWTKIGLSFCPKGKFWGFFWHLSFCKNVEKKPVLVKYTKFIFQKARVATNKNAHSVRRNFHSFSCYLSWCDPSCSDCSLETVSYFIG